MCEFIRHNEHGWIASSQRQYIGWNVFLESVFLLVTPSASGTNLQKAGTRARTEKHANFSMKDATMTCIDDVRLSEEHKMQIRWHNSLIGRKTNLCHYHFSKLFLVDIHSQRCL